MRIRTVKPEFWTHRELTKLPPMIRLMCLALLNYADDEGYFWADEDLVRAAIMPREDSKNVLGMIQECSRAGWIRLFSSKEGPIGHVINFKSHQRIDKPYPSKIKQHILQECSKNDLGTFDDHSTSVPAGIGIGIGREGKPSPDFQIPSETEVLAFADSYPGDMSRGIPPKMPEVWVLGWYSWRAGNPSKWPEDWQTDMRLKFKSDFIARNPKAIGSMVAIAVDDDTTPNL